MKLKFITCCVWIFIFINFITVTFASDVKPAPRYFLTIADIHFDPFLACAAKVPCPLALKLRAQPANQWSKLFALYDVEPPKYRVDSNYQLLIRSLNAEKEISKKRDVNFVIILGDFLPHRLRKNYKLYTQDKSHAGYQAFVRKLMQFLTNELNSRFPETDVYPLVGNNDSYHRDYFSQPNGPFFHDTASAWGQLIKTSHNRAIFLNNFPQGGYYAVDAPGQANLRLIMLNSVLFSTNALGKGIEQAANKQLDWLEKELAGVKARNQKALIAMHIPPSIDFYATLRLRLFTLMQFWRINYSDLFFDQLNQFSSNIMLVLAGHVHTDWFQVLSFRNFQAEVPISGVQSISPVFGNDPGFKIYSYWPQNLQLKDFVSYYYSLDKPKWVVEYDARQAHSNRCYYCPVVWSMNILQQANTLFRYYQYYSAIKETNQPVANR